MGGEAVKKTSIFQWHKIFKEGRENVEDVEITNENNAHYFLRYQGT